MSEEHLNQATRPMPEQIACANSLFLGVWLSVPLLFVTYLGCVTGIMEPHVPMKAVQQNWNQRVNHGVCNADSPHGFGWLRLLNTGDYLTYIGLAILALITILCYLMFLPGYIRRNGRIETLICVLEVPVLGLAASSILGASGH